MKYVIASILILLPLFCISQKDKFNFDFALIFGSCFQKDIVSIKINEVNIAKDVMLQTDMFGSASFSVSQDKRYLLVKYDAKIKR